MKIAFNNCEIDTDLFQITRNGTMSDLTPQTMRLLEFLIKNRERVVSKDQLVEQVWERKIITDATLTTAIKEARQAVGDTGREQHTIRTVYGIGYRFVADIAIENDATVKIENGSADSVAGLAPLANSDDTSDRPKLFVSRITTRSNDPEEGALADGLTEDLLASLSRKREIVVMSRFLVFGEAYGGEVEKIRASGADVREYLHGLGANYMVEGRLQRSGSVLRLRITLIDLADGSTVWSDHIDGSWEDVFEFQDNVTDRILFSIEPALMEIEREKIRRQRPADLTIWQTCQLGLGILWKYRKEDYPRAIGAFRDCIAADPTYALAHAGVAYAIVHSYKEGQLPADMAVLDEAMVHAETATRLDPNEPFAFAAKARTHLARQEYDEAIAAYAISLRMDPNRETAQMGMGYALCMLGRAEEALKHLDRFQVLIPTSRLVPTVLACRSFALTMVGRPQEALAEALTACHLPNTAHWGHIARALALAKLDRPQEAEAAIRAARQLRPDLDPSAFQAAYPFAENSDLDDAAKGLLSRTDLFRPRMDG